MEAVQEFVKPLEKYLTIVSNTLCQIPLLDNALKEASLKTGISQSVVIAQVANLVIVFLSSKKGASGWCAFSTQGCHVIFVA